MRTLFKFIAGWIFLFHIAFPNDVYQSIRVFDTTTKTINILGGLGIPLDHITGKEGVFIDLTVHEDETFELLSQGVDLEILIPDLTVHYKSRSIPSDNREFPLGSMQGNYTWDELNIRFDELQSQYPGIISERVIIGQTIEERDIWAFKVSDNPNNDENEPEVLYTALTHAREPLGMMNLFYFVQRIAEAYQTDPELTYLINNREMWFIPVINPDGYVYNESIQPDGGGMHRKNRLDTGCGDGTNRGVDINRNYGFGWGANNTGSSPNPCSTTFRGESEFSEPETQAVRDFILNNNFNNVLHYHTYSNIYIHAFGNGSLPEEPDLTTIVEIGEEMARYNGYVVGTGLSTIGYSVNGDAVDWTYGDQNIISYVPEVGSPSQGFWPSENEVIELCAAQLYPNKIFAFVSGPDIILHSYELSEEFIMPSEEVEINLVIQNRGLTNSDSDIEISLSPLNNWTSLDSESYILSEIDARDSDDFSFSFTISDDAVNGENSGIIISINSENGFSRTDTLEFLIGQPQVLFFDGFENGLDNWVVDGDWGLTNDALTGSFALSDSPEGDYQEAQETIAELSTTLNLNFLSNPIVNFSAKWDIEWNWDFVRFQANVNGADWVTLKGVFTEPGSGQPAQPSGEQGYDGYQNLWVQEAISLYQLDDDAVITGFRFIQTSDNYVEGDGFTVDDFSISGFPKGVMGDYNMDLVADIYDLLALADVILFGGQPTDAQLFFCDLDGSGIIDVMDIINLSNMILGF